MTVAGRSVKRALAAGTVLAALMPALSGCTSGEADLESRLAELSGVSGAYVWTTTSGAPTNRGLGVRLYVSERPENLSALVDDALRTTWSFSPFEPTNGVRIEMTQGERPADASPGQGGERIQVDEAVSALEW